MIAKPRRVNVGNRIYWDVPNLRLVEYVLHECQVLRAKEVGEQLTEQFGVTMHRVSVARHLAELVAEKRAVRLHHGLYAHATSVFV